MQAGPDIHVKLKKKIKKLELLKKRILKRAHKHAFVRLTAFNPCNPENQSFRHVNALS
jgi:hypothetical protein